MTIPFTGVQPRPDIAWIDSNGKPTLPLAQYMPLLDALVRSLANNNVGTLKNAANDTAAAAAGVAVGQMYRNGSVIHVRVT